MSNLRLALLVGLNKYPHSINNLKGCLNDVGNWSALLREKFGFSYSTITDEKATKKNVVSALENLVYDAQSGDSLVVQFSGHGTRISTTNAQEEDGFSEALCLYDKYLIDMEIEEILRKLKPNISLTTISDSCFSGNLTREIHSNYIKARTAQPFPLPIIKTTTRRRLFKLVDDEEQMNHILLSGCAENETSADGCFSGIFEGAFSHYAIKILTETTNITYNEFYLKLREYLPSDLYNQTPCLEGKTELKNKQIFV